MAVLAVLCALATAMCVGYYFGRRAHSTRPTWKKRTSRAALGGLVLSLLVLITARRVQHSLRGGRVFRDVLGIWGLSSVAPLEFLRGSVARMRS